MTGFHFTRGLAGILGGLLMWVLFAALWWGARYTTPGLAWLFQAFAVVGFVVMLAAPVWYWVGRPVWYRVRGVQG